MGAASSRDKCALDDAISRQDAAPTSIFQGYFVRIPKVEQSAHGRPVKAPKKAILGSRLVCQRTGLKAISTALAPEFPIDKNSLFSEWIILFDKHLFLLAKAGHPFLGKRGTDDPPQK